MLMARMAGVDLPAELPAARGAIARAAACGNPATGWLTEVAPPDLSGTLAAAPAVEEAILATREASPLLRSRRLVHKDIGAPGRTRPRGKDESDAARARP